MDDDQDDEEPVFVATGGAHGAAEDQVVADMDSDDGGAGESDADDEDTKIDQDNRVDDAIYTFTQHEDSVFSVACNPSKPGTVATGGSDDMAFIWTLPAKTDAGPSSTHKLSGHTDTVASLAFNASGELLATGGLDGQVKVWDAASGRCAHTLEGPTGAVEWVRWHPRGDVLLAGSDDFTAWMWNAATGAFMQVFTGHNGAVTCGAWTPDGKKVVTGGGEGDASLRVWSPRSGECLVALQGATFHQAVGVPGHRQANGGMIGAAWGTGLTALALSGDGAVAATGSEDGDVRLTNIDTGRLLGALAGHAASVEAVGLARSLPLVVSGDTDGRLLVWDAATFTQRSACDHPEAVTRIALDEERPLVFTACLDGAVRCWDLRSGTCLRTWCGHARGVQDLALSADGRFIVTGSDDSTARIFLLANAAGQ